jgi:hypothetical protein
MRIVVLALLSVILVLLQGIWLDPLGLPLNAPLLLTLACAWWGSRARATAAGFWNGALVGAMTGTSVAFASLYAMVGWSAATVLKTHPQRGILRASLLGASSALSFLGLENLIWILAQHPPRVEPGSLLAQLLWNGLGMGLLVGLGRFLRARRNRWTADLHPVAYGA